MTAIKWVYALLVAATVSPPETAFAQLRAKADVSCRPTSTALQYDCTFTLTNSRSSEPLTGVTLTVGADMPSMPMMHNVRPVKAAPGEAAGTYLARLELEMHGDWAVQLNLSGPLRDRLVSILRFEPDRVAPTAAPKAPPRHKH
jgi:hypothetical protein